MEWHNPLSLSTLLHRYRGYRNLQQSSLLIYSVFKGPEHSEQKHTHTHRSIDPLPKMTTIARIDATLARFDRKSPRDAYKQVCEELDVHYQKAIYNSLPDVPSAFHRIQTLNLEDCLLGSKGCMALLPIILVSTALRRVCLRSCGISDEFVKELCEIAQGHQGIREVDICDNELVTVYSATHIISLMRNNSNMTSFDVEGTHIGTNVANIIAALAQENTTKMTSYYQDNYFKMKDLFNYLDENGYGWVPLKSLLLNCPYPMLQEQFVERIATKKPRKRSDNTISINSFLNLVYMNYKSETEIAQHGESNIDEPYVFMVANWKQIIDAVARYNESSSVTVTLEEEGLHRLRIREYLLTNENASELVQGAVNLVADQLTERGEELGETVALSAAVLVTANKTTYEIPPSTKPVYSFFQVRDANYIPDCMRNGSRIFSMGNLNMLEQSMQGTFSDIGMLDSEASHTFSLPACLVKMIVDFFNREHGKLPRKKESAIPDSPRTKRDKAMEKASIPTETFLAAEFVTDFEKVCPRLLADYFSRYALTIEDTTITLQEMVNVLDELYVQTRIDSILTLSQIQSMENPLKVKKFGEFLQRHLLERDEDVRIIEMFRKSVAY